MIISVYLLKILNLVFVWAVDGTSLKVDVPIVFKGEDKCPGLNKGGFLRKIRPCLKFLCLAESIPPKIEVDVTNLDIGEKVYMHDVTVDPSLKLLSKDDSIPICKIGSTEMDNYEVAK
ncbi:ribosomal protein [Lithospermum erythrorhizon]|uniref:Ribosomal protein n=1 Tax=Lithospermum erythrorhizon TaxID=34254 RepID=A0AAV3RLG5_LITER